MKRKPMKPVKAFGPFNHSELCRLFVAANCPVGVECEHGVDVCPICDPCNCDLTEIREIRPKARKVKPHA